MESALPSSATTHRRRFRLCFNQSLLTKLESTRLQEIMTDARAAAADSTLRILAIEYPTRSLILEGTNRGFNRLLAVYFHGTLDKQILGVTALSAIV